MPRPLRYAALVFAIAVSATCGDKSPLGVEANHPPIVGAIQLTIDEDSSGVADVLAIARDVDGDSLTLTLWGQGNHGAVARDGVGLRYTPAPNYNGPDAFPFTVADGNGGEAQDTVHVTVLPVNDAPVAADDSARGDEDARLDVDVLANDTDVDGDSLFIVVAEDGAHGASLTDGTVLSYVPEPNFNGTDTLRYVVADGAGGRDSARVVVTIVPVNDPPVAASDSVVVNEDDSVVVDVLANDTDAEGDSLRIAAFTQGSIGTVSQVAGGLRYVPAPNANGTDSLSYTVSDGNGGEANGSVFVTVTPVNDAPVAIDDSVTTSEETGVFVDPAANDIDVDGDSLVVVPGSPPAHGTLAPEGSGFRYTPAANFNGADQFTYAVSDGIASDTGTVWITVTAVNDPPVASADTATLPEDSSALVDVLANDVDPDDSVLTVTVVANPAHGTAAVEGTAIRYTPAANYNGTDTFNYSVSDGKAADTAAVALVVTPVNDAPVAVDDSAATSEDDSVLVQVLANDTDIDGDALTITGFTQGSHGAVTQEGNALRYTPAANSNGSDSFSYDISDGHGGTATANVTVSVAAVNDPPVAQPDSATLDEDSTVLVDVLANDSDPDGDSLMLSGFAQGAHGTVAQEGTALRYTPAANYNGSDSFSYTVADGQGGADTTSVFVTVAAVNDPPVAVADNASVDEDGTVLIDVLLNDSDIDGDALALTGFTQGAHGTVAQEGNALRYTPAANYNGADSFSYDISDGNGGVNTATVTITVNAVNDPPVAQPDSATLDEDSTVLVDVLANDSDPDGDSLALSGFTQGAHGTVTQEGAALRYAPAANYNGSDSFSYTVADGQGGADTATVTVTVAAVNDPPVAQPDSAALDEDSTVLVDVLANDSDIDGDSLSVASFTQGAHGTVTQDGTGLRYTPAANYNGADSFLYTVVDGQGGADTASVFVNVAPVNDVPVAVADNASVDEDGTVLIDVLLNDSDIDGDALALTGFTQGAHGTVAQEGNALRYTPAANYNGTDSFSYDISDGNGGVNTATVTITVNAVNDPPVAQPDSAALDEDSTVLVDVLANDSDPDGDSLALSSFAQGAHGTVTQEGTELRYTPAPNFNGSDSFTYTVTDSNGATATANVIVTVNPVNDPPVAVDDSATIDEDVSSLIDVLANDSDLDGDTLHVSGYTQPAHGTVTADSGALRYSPDASYTGPDSFSYDVSDASGATATATVTVTVRTPNHAPVAGTDAVVVLANGSVLVDVLANDSDVDGDSLAISSFDNPGHGSVVREGNALRYTPAADYYGMDSFVYYINDGNGGSATGVVDVKVDGYPKAVYDFVTVTSGSSATFNVIANDSDPEGDPLTVSLDPTWPAAHGTVTVVNINGGIQFTPDPGYTGIDGFGYFAVDPYGAKTWAFVRVTVVSP